MSVVVLVYYCFLFENLCLIGIYVCTRDSDKQVKTSSSSVAFVSVRRTSCFAVHKAEKNRVARTYDKPQLGIQKCMMNFRLR